MLSAYGFPFLLAALVSYILTPYIKKLAFLIGAIVKKIFLKHGLQLARHVYAIQNGDGLAIAAHGLGYTHQVVIGLLEAKAVMEHHLPLQS